MYRLTLKGLTDALRAVMLQHIGVESTKRIDLIIVPVNWALELLRDGDDLGEHEARFKPGGHYENYGFKQYAVVDFRSFPYRQPRPRQNAEHTYFVLFENKEYTKATVLHASTGTTWHVPLAS